MQDQRGNHRHGLCLYFRLLCAGLKVQRGDRHVAHQPVLLHPDGLLLLRHRHDQRNADADRGKCHLPVPEQGLVHPDSALADLLWHLRPGPRPCDRVRLHGPSGHGHGRQDRHEQDHRHHLRGGRGRGGRLHAHQPLLRHGAQLPGDGGL